MRTIFAIDVRCGVCQAPPGTRCHRLDDAQYFTEAPHESRRQLAREERVRLNPEHVDGQLPLWPRKASS